MKTDKPPFYRQHSLLFILVFLVLIWLSYLVSLAIPNSQLGLVPRTYRGLLGVLLSPFIHGSLAHLISNSISFTLFAIIMALLEGNKMFVKVLLMLIIGGLLTWLMGRSANHIGASGLIFSLWGYMLFSGWFSKKLKYVLVSIVLISFYGGMVFSLFPGEEGISWESHFFGFIAGFIVSWLYHK